MFFLIIRWIRMAFQAVQNVRHRWAPELQQLSDHIEKKNSLWQELMIAYWISIP